MRPVNDSIKVRIDDKNEYGFGGDDSGVADSGIVVDVPDVMFYLGLHSSVIEKSFLHDGLQQILDSFEQLKGKRVYWTSLQERGNVIKEGEETFAIMKMTDIIAVSEPDDIGVNVRTGEFAV